MTTEYWVTKDGDDKTGPHESWLYALGSVLQLQGRSFWWAQTYEGWDIEVREGANHVDA